MEMSWSHVPKVKSHLVSDLQKIVSGEAIFGWESEQIAEIKAMMPSSETSWESVQIAERTTWRLALAIFKQEIYWTSWSTALSSLAPGSALVPKGVLPTAS